jgi:hypothetical protein
MTMAENQNFKSKGKWNFPGLILIKMEGLKMKNKRFLKVITLVITVAILLILGSLRKTEAQTYVTVAADHDLNVESDYEYFSARISASAYFEIKFDIEEGTGEDIEIILAADEDEGDYEVDDDTFIWYLGDDAYSTNNTSYDDFGPDDDGDVEVPSFSNLLLLAALEDDDWIDYEWDGAKIEKITVILVYHRSTNRSCQDKGI